MQQIYLLQFSVGQAVEWNFVWLRSGWTTLPGPPQLCYVSLLFPALKSLCEWCPEKAPPGTKHSRPSAQQHGSLCMQLYIGIYPWIGIFDSPFLATLTSLDVSMTALKLLESRDSQKTGPKPVPCSSCLLEKVFVVSETLSLQASVHGSILACFPLGLMCVCVCVYIYVCI